MTRNASDHAGSFNAIKRNPSSSSSKSSSELEEMRQLFKSNRESLRSMETVIMPRCSFLPLFYNREFENSPQLRRSRVHFAGIPSETTQMQMSSTFMPDRLLNESLFYDLFLQILHAALTGETWDGASYNYYMLLLFACGLLSLRPNHSLCCFVLHTITTTASRTLMTGR